LKTYQITAAIVLLLFLSASGAEYATDKNSAKLSGRCSFALASGELYEIGESSVTHLLLSIHIAGFERRGLGLGLTIEYEGKYDNNQGDNQTLLTFGPDITAYPFKMNGSAGLSGSVLPYVSFGVLSTQPLGSERKVVSGRIALGGDCMLSESVALDISIQGERLWRSGATAGYAVSVLAGLAYHVF
jgi:hypothetical protein